MARDLALTLAGGGNRALVQIGLLRQWWPRLEPRVAVRRHLILLTRPYPAASVGRKGIRWYLCPSEPVPISRWEYTRPDLIEATIALGEREAVLREAEFAEFLAAE